MCSNGLDDDGVEFRWDGFDGDGVPSRRVRVKQDVDGKVHVAGLRVVEPWE